MIELWEIMGRPLVACLIMSGIHVYFGLHVVARGVIFVDLAMAQVAALGSSLGFLLGFGFHAPINYWLSLLFTLVAALIFSFMHKDKTKVPAEAYIGICYAVAAAALILVLSIAPEGGEELRAKAVGHLLFVTWGEIVNICLIYALVALFHYIYRRNFIELSFASQSFSPSRVWHFLFYATFGVVVSCSVEIAGVLLVFAILIVPTVCAMLFKESIKGRLGLGWVISFCVSVVGILMSFFLDLPTGATIVCSFGFCLLLSLAWDRLTQ